MFKLFYQNRHTFPIPQGPQRKSPPALLPAGLPVCWAVVGAYLPHRPCL
ncbi:hypothetical protein APS_0696 [Acetobacter pasteurianus subsp. pasteurianus LMG 1262 = NBRC 106471]|nr:hypothetical protein APS_0696 [Acetobacter pasteurianus subsp. pasteurianus LMG 1262 = NBRC 106471]